MVGKWKTLESKEQGRGRIFRHRVVKRKSPDTGAEGAFDVIDCLDWVNVIALTPQKEIIFVKQYRHGSDHVTHEIPGGAIDLGEDPEHAAKRELEEETGYQCQRMEFLGKVAPNPAFMSNHCYTYLAHDCHPTSVQNLDPLEEIEVTTLPQENVKEMLSSGEIDHSLVVAAFFYFFTK